MKKNDNTSWINNLKNEIDKSILTGLVQDSDDFDLKGFYNSIEELKEFKKFESKNAWQKVSKSFNRSNYSWIKYAASIVIILSIGLSYLFFSSDNKYYNSSTTDKHVVLADGSDIILKQGAELTISNDFNDKSRMVELSGDGYFNITKNKDKPFIILTKKAKVEVLGTVFFIDQEPEIFQLELESGKVSIETKDKNYIVMTPGHKAIVDSKILVENVDDNSLMNKNLSDLFFNNITLDKAIKKINIIYNKEIIAPVDNKLANETIHMTVKDSSVREFLNGLKLIFNVDIEYSKGKYFIKSLKK